MGNYQRLQEQGYQIDSWQLSITADLAIDVGMQNAACASRGALIYYMRKARLRYLLACFQRTPLSTRQLVEPSTSATHPLDDKDQEQPPPNSESMRHLFQANF